MRSVGGAAVFFFQAEDGIRDKLVTGVQTCALPIWPLFHSLRGTRGAGNRRRDERRVHRGSPARRLRGGGRERDLPQRSEERRVGKECRSRWSPYQQKKNNTKTTAEVHPHNSTHTHH